MRLAGVSGKLLAASLCLNYATAAHIPDRCNYLG